MRAAIYIRVSTNDQSEKGYSLDTQLEANINKAVQLGSTSWDIYRDDGFSGEYLERPDITRLRKALQTTTYNFVVIYDPDRLARNLSHQLLLSNEIEKSGAQLHFATEEFKHTAEGMLYFSMRGAIAQYEKEKIRERTMRGKKGKLQKGKIINRTSLYGFDWDKDGSNYVINQDQAIVVRYIYKTLLEEKIGCLKIANKLNKMGIARSAVAKWHYAAVYKILTDEKYAGVHHAFKYYHAMDGIKKRKAIKRDEAEWIQVPVPAIIDRETWEKAQLQLKENKQTSSRKTKRLYLLKDILICDKCGKKMSPYWNGDKNNSVYYGCRSKRGVLKDRNCGSRFIGVEYLENVVWETVKKLCDNPDELRAYLEISEPEDTESQRMKLDRLVDQERKLIKLRDKYMSWFEQDVITEDEADKKLSDIKRQINEINETRKKILPTVHRKATAERILAEYSSRDYSVPENRAILFKSILKAVYAVRLDKDYGKTNVAVKVEFS